MEVNPSELYQNLLKDLGPIGNGFITSDMTLSRIESLWLARSFLKKLEGKKTKDADDAALSKFLACNERCRDIDLTPKELYMDIVTGQARAKLDACFHRGPTMVPSLADFKVCELGSGANLGLNSTNFYTKLFDSGLSSTSESLYRFYRCLIADNPTWYEAEAARASCHGYDLRAGSKLSFVPKTTEISRTICTEPTLNMFFQRGIGNFLEDVLKQKFNIDLEFQPDINREMARLGSLDGSFGTIDLQSASDCISNRLIRSYFPVHMVNWFMRTRSPSTVLPDGTLLELEMVSSMGNGFTFPLQTLIFAVIVTSCYEVLGIKPEDGRGKAQRNFSIFGDDIIVLKETFEFVKKALSCFGFMVNEDKSFNSGEFRESCGGDYYRGLDIRGVYLRKLQDRSDVYSIINRLTRWSARSGVILDFTQCYLRMRCRFLPIPYRDGDSEGIKITSAWLTCEAYDIDTRSLVYRALRVNTVGFAFPDERLSTESKRALKKARVDLPYSGFRYNGCGLTLTAVGGFARDGRIALRIARKAYHVSWCTVPYWDWIPTSDSIHYRGGDWEVFADRYASLMLAPER